MQYLTHAEYMEMGGTVENTAFIRFEWEARREVDYYTHQRIIADIQKGAELENTPYFEALQMLIFALVELGNKYSLVSDEKTITSTSNNGISVSYQSTTMQEANTARKKLIKNYLDGCQDSQGVNLLWVGV